jgi:hypothetical protein
MKPPAKGATVSFQPESITPSVAGDPFLNAKKAEIEKAAAEAAAIPILFPPHTRIWVCSRQRHDGQLHPLMASPQEAECHRLSDLWLQDARKKEGRYATEHEGWDMVLTPKFRPVPIFEVVPE